MEHINGVIELSSRVVSYTGEGILLFVFGAVVLALGVWLFGEFKEVVCDLSDLILGIAPIALIICGVWLVSTSLPMFNGQHTEYKVLIYDSVSHNEFNETYHIVDQEDLIFTVKEKMD